MALTYQTVYEWLANVPAQDLTDAMVAEKAAYWGLSVAVFTALLLATGLYVTTGGGGSFVFVTNGLYSLDPSSQVRVFITH